MCKQKIPFTKPVTSIDQQLEILKSRGLVLNTIPNYENIVNNALLYNNYYRLEGYWFDYYDENTYPNHVFKQNASFQQIWNNYKGDAILRHSTFAIIAQIEVSFRSIFAYILAKNHGPFPYKQSDLDCGIETYLKAMTKMKDDIQHSKDHFIHAFINKYSDPIPPIWMMVEIMSMGELSKWYGDCIKDSDKKEIASYYGIPAKVLESWMRSISMVRNRCAHHNRLYGISISGGFVIPRKITKQKYLKLFNTNDINGFYNIIVACCYLVESLVGNREVKDFLDNILQLTENFGLEEEKMGFPYGKTALDLFQEIDT